MEQLADGMKQRQERRGVGPKKVSSRKTMWNVMMMIVPLSMSMAAKNFIPLDLSYDRGPLRWRKSTILVANFATTEHVANQLNAFRVIRDLTKPGGMAEDCLSGHLSRRAKPAHLGRPWR